MITIEIKIFYFNTAFYIKTPEDLLDKLIQISAYNYYESYSSKSYFFHVQEEQLENFEKLLYDSLVPYKKVKAGEEI